MDLIGGMIAQETDTIIPWPLAYDQMNKQSSLTTLTFRSPLRPTKN